MSTEKKKKFLIDLLWITVVCLIAYLVIRFLGDVILPFFIGFLISALARPISKRIGKKLKKGKKLVDIITLTLVYAVLVLVVFLIGSRIVAFTAEKIGAVPEFFEETVRPNVESVFEQLELMFPKATFNFSIDTVMERVVGILTDMASAGVRFLTGFAISIPNLIVDITFVIASSYFFLLDFEQVTAIVMRQFKPETQEKLRATREITRTTIVTYLKVYGIIIVCTFTELLIGFLLIGVKAPVGLSIIIALVDIFPIVGVGTFLIPWGVALFILGKFRRGLAILALYAVITAIRQVIEPKIVDKTIGIPALFTLLGIFLGAKLMGLLGIFIVPLAFAVIKRLNDEGIFKIYK